MTSTLCLRVSVAVLSLYFLDFVVVSVTGISVTGVEVCMLCTGLFFWLSTPSCLQSSLGLLSFQKNQALPGLFEDGPGLCRSLNQCVVVTALMNYLQ